MKIYCYRQLTSDSDIINNIIGRDVWVLGKFRRWFNRLQKCDWSTHNFWIKFVYQTDTQYKVVFKIVEKDNDGRSYDTDYLYISRLRLKDYENEENEKWINKEDIQLYRPVETLTTDELFSADPEDWEIENEE